MTDQLGLWETDEDIRRRQAVTWNRMYREFQESLAAPPIKHPDYDFYLDQEICLRCGESSYSGTITINHDLGWCGCPNESDPTWKHFEKSSGWRGVVDADGNRRGQLTPEEMADRWDCDKLPHCECGHSFGLHKYGRSCYLYCGCDGYEANAPTTTH